MHHVLRCTACCIYVGHILKNMLCLSIYVYTSWFWSTWPNPKIFTQSCQWTWHAGVDRHFTARLANTPSRKSWTMPDTSPSLSRVFVGFTVSIEMGGAPRRLERCHQEPWVMGCCRGFFLWYLLENFRWLLHDIGNLIHPQLWWVDVAWVLTLFNGIKIWLVLCGNRELQYLIVHELEKPWKAMKSYYPVNMISLEKLIVMPWVHGQAWSRIERKHWCPEF